VATVRKENGFILIIMLFLLLLLAVTAMSLNVKSGMQVKMAVNQSDDAQTSFDQLAVIEESVWQLARDPFWRPTQPSTSYPQYNRTVTNSAISSYTDAVIISVRAPNASRPLNTSFRYNIKTPFLVRKPRQVSSDSAGNIYFADMDNHSVLKIDGSGVPSLVAGNGASGFSGDNGPATEAKLNSPQGVCAYGSSIYIADTGNNLIRKVTGTTITTIAGTGTAGYGGDGGAATAAMLSSSRKVAVDTAGNLYIADTGNNRIRKVTVATGIISLVAGTGAPGSTGDGGLAINATLNSPAGVAVDASGNVYIADTGNNKIRKVTGTTITTVAGTGTAGFDGDGTVLASSSKQLNQPQSVFVDVNGDIYIADTRNNRIRKVTTWTFFIFQMATFTTIAGTGTAGYGGDGGLATAALIDSPTGVCVTTGGKVMIADTMNSCLRKVEAGNITTWPATWPEPWPEKRTAGRGLNNPQAIAAYYDTALKKVFLFIADTGNHRIRKLDPDATTDTIVTVAGTGSADSGGDTGLAVNATLNSPAGVAVDASGNVYIADTGNHKIRKVTAATGIISLVAGTGSAGALGDGSAATNAQLYSPAGVAVDSSGNVYIADTGNNKVRKVTAATGIIATVAGTGTAGHGGDGGAATLAKLDGPKGVALDVSDNLYIADTGSNHIREVMAASGIINVVAGSAPGGGYSGDGGAATSAKIQKPQSVAVDTAGNIYIADTGNHALRLVNIHNGIISTMTYIDPAIGPVSGYNGDLRPGVQAYLNSPAGVALGLQKGGGRIFISDSNNNRIRMLFLKTVKEVYGP
jgi:trimeric autotransporter adhesin